MSSEDDRSPAPGRSRSPAPLGRDEGAGAPRVLGREPTPARAGKKAPKAGAPSAGVELTVITTFPNPFKKDIAKEVDAMKNKRWEPSTDDFHAVGGNVQEMNTYLQMLGLIVADGDKARAKGTIDRINVFTHANRNLIAFKGTVEPREVSATVMLDVDSALSMDNLERLNGDGFYFTVASKALANKQFTMKDVHARFRSKKSLLVLYACHSGLDHAFLQELADTFQVTVRGFKDVIGYFPRYDISPPRVDRKHVGVGYNATVHETDFHKLDTPANVIEKTPR